MVKRGMVRRWMGSSVRRWMGSRRWMSSRRWMGSSVRRWMGSRRWMRRKWFWQEVDGDEVDG